MLFSIIIPVYNVEAYLPRCIESALRQTCKDYEILLIDDGSTDTSGEICDEYAQKYAACQVIHQKNTGLAGARNAGLDRAQGKYIVFLDSDDYIAKELLMKAAHELERKGCDTCSYMARRVAEDESYLYEMFFDGTMIRNFDFDSEDRLRFLLTNYLQYKIGWEACFFVYSRSIIEERHLRFSEEIRFAEDLPFTFHYMMYTKSLVKIPDVLYNYTYRQTSITSREKEESQIRGMFGINYRAMKQVLLAKFPERDQKELEVLLYAAMLLYFMPQYCASCSQQEIREILLSNSGAREIWDRIIQKRKELCGMFRDDEVERIIKWVEQR